MKTKIFILLLLSTLTLSYNIKANNIDKVANCGGLVVGNAAVDYIYGSEQAFTDGIKVAYYAYVPTLNGVASLLNYSDEDRAFADQIFSSNIDKVINAYNNENYDTALYEEIVGCYRMLGLVLIDPATQYYLKDSKDVVDAKIEKTINNLKRIFDAM